MIQRIVKAENIRTRQVTAYLVPSKPEALRHSEATWGSQYDPVERRVMEGGLPMLWPRATTTEGQK